jgi:hypothetical protein
MDVKYAAYNSSFMAALPIAVVELRMEFGMRRKSVENKIVRLDLSKSREM